VVGQNEELINKTLTWCKEIENLVQYPKGSIRDEITGPIVDAIFNENNIFRKQISNGLVFDFYYRTKIARDFLMSTPEKPDHVWEPQTTKLLMLLSKNLKEVLIGGAYFGDQAILLANEIKKNNGCVHAFEPNLDQFNMLKHNADINGINNIKLGEWVCGRIAIVFSASWGKIPLHMLNLLQKIRLIRIRTFFKQYQ
jgi:hypothetical protein